MQDNTIQRNNYFDYRNVDASIYENITLPIWIKNEITDRALTILDYGCGFGQHIKALLAEEYTCVYGVDIEKKAIEYCLQKDYKVKELDLTNLSNPFNIKFDVIILSHVLEHIPKNEIINTIRLIKKDFLSENGKLLLAVPNAQSNTDCYWAYEDWTHTTLFTSGSIYYVLKASGFEKIEFLDIDCTLGNSVLKSLVRKIFLKLFVANKMFWNKITCSSYHQPSAQIFSYELKVRAC